jgi:hypothetical protein
VDCLGWGVTRSTGWLCEGCRGWRRKISRGEGCCATCASRRHLNVEGLCRLCRRQAAMVRAIRKGATAEQANRHGQQLYLAGTFWGLRKPGPATVIPRHAPHVVYPVTHRQLVLFELPRDLPAGRCRGFPEPTDPCFAALLDRAARNHAARHGWSKTRTAEARQAIHILLGLQDTPGAPVQATDVAKLAQIGIAVQPVLDILAEEGTLDEDREPSISGWFARQIAGLPGPMTSELRIWFSVLLNGSTTPPRRRGRSLGTARLHVYWVEPTLRSWAAAGHQSLREISRTGVLAALPPDGTPRADLGQGLRSLFTVLKQRKVIFTNPMARIRTGKPETRQPLPLGQLPALRDALNSADPAQAAITALIAYYGLRNQDVRHLLLTNVNGTRLHIGGRTVLLAPPVRQRLSGWLDHRAARWPATLNPHLFINTYTAVRGAAVSYSYVRETVGMAVQPIREDRILHEALATGGDVRQLTDLFGLSVAAALRYTAALDPPGLTAQLGHENQPPPPIR